jgi:aspartate/methionine/tyrosine aminotransferase
MNELLEQLPSPPAIAIADLVRQLELSGETIAKMQTGEPCFNTPEYIIKAAHEALKLNKTYIITGHS